jgi:hypothetical protein
VIVTHRVRLGHDSCRILATDSVTYIKLVSLSITSIQLTMPRLPGTNRSFAAKRNRNVLDPHLQDEDQASQTPRFASWARGVCSVISGHAPSQPLRCSSTSRTSADVKVERFLTLAALSSTMMSSISPDGAETGRDMRESQRALELRKYVLNPRRPDRASHTLPTRNSRSKLRFFAPQHTNNTAVEIAFNDSLNNDGTLDAYAETIVWRLRGVHAMVRYV